MDRGLLDLEPKRLVCTFTVAAHQNCDPQIRVVTDASPWGLGGMLVVSDVIVSWFYVPLTEFDASYFKCPLGGIGSFGHAGGSLVLAKFVAGNLVVKSDNVAALTFMATPKSSPTSNVVDREIVLDIALGSLQLDIFSHAPGVSATVVDNLSRRYQPGVQFSTPTLDRCARGLPARLFPDIFLGFKRAASHSAAGIKERVASVSTQVSKGILGIL